MAGEEVVVEPKPEMTEDQAWQSAIDNVAAGPGEEAKKPESTELDDPENGKEKEVAGAKPEEKSTEQVLPEAAPVTETVDYRKRYEDMRSEFDRRGSEVQKLNERLASLEEQTKQLRDTGGKAAEERIFEGLSEDEEDLLEKNPEIESLFRRFEKRVLDRSKGPKDGDLTETIDRLRFDVGMMRSGMGDWEDVVKTPEFVDWFKDQPEPLKAKAGTWNPEDGREVMKAFSAHKTAKKVKGHEAGQRTERERQETAGSGTVTSLNQRRAAAQPTEGEPLSEDELWEKAVGEVENENRKK